MKLADLRIQFSTGWRIDVLVARSIRRIGSGEDRIKYDHLFDVGDTINKEFFQKAKSLDANLSDSFIVIEDDSPHGRVLLN